MERPGGTSRDSRYPSLEVVDSDRLGCVGRVGMALLVSLPHPLFHPFIERHAAWVAAVELVPTTTRTSGIGWLGPHPGWRTVEGIGRKRKGRQAH